MRKNVRPMITAVLGAVMLPSLLGLTGCSGEGAIATPKADVVKKRDELQKATQSGVPGGAGGRPGRRQR